MATQTQPMRSYDSHFRGVPTEVRTMIWQHCIAVAPRTSETIEHGDFDFMIRRSDRPRYIPLDYIIQQNVVYITGISIQDLGVVLADKKTSAEVVGMLREQMSLSFRALHLGDFRIVKKLGGLRERVSSVTLFFGSDLRAKLEEDVQGLNEVMKYLDGFQAGTRLFVFLSELAVEQLMEVNLQLFAALLQSPGFQGAVEHIRRKAAEELDSGMREEFGRVVGGRFNPQGANGDASRYHCFNKRFVILDDRFI
ncbi:hypothetical protein V8E51_015605 [Hyaloscypha variabilis]